ncbi:MAG: hypothetical protein ABIL25_08515 [candidate division WOR-3 bacterium]
MARVVPGGDRTARWNLKYDPNRIKEITEAGKPTYLQHASAIYAELAEMEVAVKQVLNAEGVSVSAVPDYLCFGREMWAKSGRYSGETLAREAATLIGKWVARGLTQSVLETIRTQVFNVGPPTP